MNKSMVRKKQQYPNYNNIETYKSIGSAITQSLGNDLIKGGTNDVKEQLFGIGLTGDLMEGEDLILKPSIKDDVTPQENNRPKLDIEPGIDYGRELLHGYRKIAQENTQEISKKIQEIIVELKRLTVSSKELQIEFKEVAIEQRVVNPGKYHASFFEWVLSAIKLARMKVEDSGAWLSVSKSKKAKREYWAMFKKHGTTFGLSNERVVATQTG